MRLNAASLRYWCRTGLAVRVRQLLHRREVHPVLIREGLQRSRFIVAIIVKDEADRLRHLLDYYRSIGADHFIIVDNESSDGLDELARCRDDASIFRAVGQFKAAHFGIDWVNHVLHKHCRGKWVIHVDADEYLTWAGSHKTLPEVCGALESAGRSSAQALMLDMYSSVASRDNVVSPGQDPGEVTRLFDSSGYVHRFDSQRNLTWIKGGVRGRHFFADDIWSGPALNKSPLVRWSRWTAFVNCAHEVWPPSLNGGRRSPQLALLHYKFVEQSVRRATDSGVRSQHTEEYAAYDEIQDRLLSNETTRRFDSAEDLVDAGLIERTC